MRDIMIEQVRPCFEVDDLDQVANTMAELEMRRLPVLNHDKHLVGIVAFGDLATAGKAPGHAEAPLQVSPAPMDRYPLHVRAKKHRHPGTNNRLARFC